ncbi:MAG: glycoside hydrolase family 28 protein [Bacteroidales bacterium]|nr:glycoside hydrolase family 28 protein [Bacteroidales bacterium]
MMLKPKYVVFLITLVFTNLVIIGKGQDEKRYNYLYTNLPFGMEHVVVPVFSDLNYSITDFGGIGDGVFLNTEAFSKAIDALSQKGGGTLTVPAGIWLTGPITLKSNINLHLEEGALVIFSKNYDDYPLIETYFEGIITKRCISPINGRGLENIAITGKGIIDGSGEVWRPVKKSKMTSEQWKQLVASGGVLNKSKDTWYPTLKSLEGSLRTTTFNVPEGINTEEEWNSVKDFLRPVMIGLVECKKVLLEGVVFQNSPAWNLHPLMCQDLTIDGVTVRNPWYSQNGDGIDLESCKNVIIANSTFDVGDDAICIKSGKDEQGRKRGLPTENVIINNCTVYHGHGGFVIGSEMSGGARNIKVSNCTFIGTDVGLRFKSNRGRGGIVENIYVESIKMINIPTEAILFDIFYNGKSATELLEEGETIPVNGTYSVSVETPVFRKISFNNITCNGARRAIFFNGLPEMNIQDIIIKNVTISSQLGADIRESDQIILENVRILNTEGPAITLKNSKNIDITGFSSNKDMKRVLKVEGENSRNIRVKSGSISKENTLVEKDVKEYPEIIK